MALFHRSPQLPIGWARAFLWRLVVYLHLTPTIFWWWLMPGGFPANHARFWINSVFPFVVIAVCLACLWAERRGNATLRMATAITIPAFWLAATLTAGILFPVSARRFLPPALICVAVICVIFWVSFRRLNLSWKVTAIAVVPAIASAIGFVWAQRGGEPDTAPVNVAMPQFEHNVDSRLMQIPVRLADHITVQTASGHVVIRHETLRGTTDDKTDLPNRTKHSGRSYSIDIEPLLTFESRSPDRFWTILAPKQYRDGPLRQLKSLRQDDGDLLALYENDTRSVLHVSASANGDGTTIDAMTQLDKPIYSHLNSFVAFTVSGCLKPALGFSPCQGLRVDVEPSDYPFGRPLRLAYFDGSDIFHVAQAKSGEKGPFAEFGSGSLPRGAPLILTLFDDGQPVCQITLDDWSSQAGHGLSPTAGWGLPMNAIEFSQLGDDSGIGPIAIWVTLAGTSVGRGWDSVGHAAGTYRNRIQIEWIGAGLDQK